MLIENDLSHLQEKAAQLLEESGRTLSCIKEMPPEELGQETEMLLLRISRLRARYLHLEEEIGSYEKTSENPDEVIPCKASVEMELRWIEELFSSLRDVKNAKDQEKTLEAVQRSESFRNILQNHNFIPGD